MKSPLRYPGGKAKFYPILLDVFEKNKIKNPLFIEPFAGGAGLGLKLL
ncbi:MAG: DNA adenine methylase, partial [Fusobacteriaceae bacterium]|nr:DNA adenine methylase [Fusobacteriaceae bacterium]